MRPSGLREMHHGASMRQLPVGSGTPGAEETGPWLIPIATPSASRGSRRPSARPSSAGSRSAAPSRAGPVCAAPAAGRRVRIGSSAPGPRPDVSVACRVRCRRRSRRPGPCGCCSPASSRGVCTRSGKACPVPASGCWVAPAARRGGVWCRSALCRPPAAWRWPRCWPRPAMPSTRPPGAWSACTSARGTACSMPVACSWAPPGIRSRCLRAG